MEMRDQVQRAVYSMISICRKLYIPIDLQTELYNTLVLPVITHASEFDIIRKMEMLQVKYPKHNLL